jgi:hypothetical protein
LLSSASNWSANSRRTEVRKTEPERLGQKGLARKA